MTSSTTTPADVKDIQDRQANGRAAVIDATMVNGITVDPKLIEAAMMALVEHWRAEADIWEASKRRGAVGTAKELRAAASRLAGFAVGLSTRPIAQPVAIDPMNSLEGIAQDARSIIDQITICAHPDEAWSMLRDGSAKCTTCGLIREQGPITLTGDEPIGTKVTVGGVEFTKIGNDPFGTQTTEEENLREMIGPLGASAIMDNPFVSPSINARPNVTIPFFGLTEISAKLSQERASEGRERNVSHSYVETYESCSLAALLRDASKHNLIGAQRPSWSQVGGNAFHAAVNKLETMILDEAIIFVIGNDTAETIGSIGSCWNFYLNAEIEAKRQELAGTPYADPATWYVSNRGKEGFDWWRVEGAKMLETYLKFHDQAWRAANQTLMVKDSTPCLELAYEMTVRSIDGERGITSKGFIDRAILSLGDHPTHPWHITVVDYKTGARDPISTFQLGEYAHALLLEMGLTDEPPGRPILGSYWLARKGIYTTPVPVIARHPLHELQYRYDAVMRGTTAGVFAPHVTNMCSSCSMIDYCPAQAGRS